MSILATVPLAKPAFDRLVVLGAAGDLASRHLLAALAALLAAGELPPALRIVAVDRAPLTGPTYRQLATARLAEHARGTPAAVRATLVRRLEYAQVDVAEHPDLRPVLGEEPVIAYAALPPMTYAPAVRALRAGGMAPTSRLVLEKPFGHDRASAAALSRLAHGLVPERDLYRVDHFLHHQSVRDLLAVRLSGAVLAPGWDGRHVESVEIVWEERGGVAGRVDYYDHTGALVDMVQSHLLQLLALVAMEPAAAPGPQTLRDQKADVLASVRPPDPDEVATRTARGRYSAGTVDGKPQRGYLEEEGVVPARGTETYVCLRLDVDTPRWRGVPFVLRTGKAVGRPRRHVELRLRPAPDDPSAPRAVLGLHLGPDRLALRANAAGRTRLPDLKSVRLGPRPRRPLPASARLLRDVLRGDPTFAVGADENQECWRIVDAVRAGWRVAGAPALREYPAGLPAAGLAAGK